MSGIRKLVGRIKRLPFVYELLRRRYYRFFLSEHGYALHYGVYDNFEEARRQVPASREFDTPEQAAEFNDRLHRIFPYDYPVLLWLDRAIAGGARRILDVGGNIGVHYFAYQKFLTYPSDLRWTVCDVPTIITEGEKTAREHGATGLEFTSDLTPGAVAAADVFLSAGSIHYIEKPRLADLLAGAKHRPRHILLNKLPLYDGPEFVSLQNIRNGFAPHLVFNRAEFVAKVESFGYELVDQWSVLERNFWVHGDADRSFGAYSGVYFRQRA